MDYGEMLAYIVVIILMYIVGKIFYKDGKEHAEEKYKKVENEQRKNKK